MLLNHLWVTAFASAVSAAAKEDSFDYVSLFRVPVNL